MTAETENLVLELLRGMRPDMDGLRRDIAAVNARLDGLDAIGTRMEGSRSVSVATTGSLVTDMRDHETRISAVEGARV